jgi:hypothetical protein
LAGNEIFRWVFRDFYFFNCVKTASNLTVLSQMFFSFLMKSWYADLMTT